MILQAHKARGAANDKAVFPQGPTTASLLSAARKVTRSCALLPDELPQQTADAGGSTLLCNSNQGVDMRDFILGSSASIVSHYSMYFS